MQIGMHPAVRQRFLRSGVSNSFTRRPIMANPHIHSVDEPIKLTKREIEVLTLVFEGRTSKEVADMLYISKRTVDFHLANIFDKLQVSNRVQACRRAARLGLLDMSSIEVSGEPMV